MMKKEEAVKVLETIIKKERHRQSVAHERERNEKLQEIRKALKSWVKDVRENFDETVKQSSITFREDGLYGTAVFSMEDIPYVDRYNFERCSIVGPLLKEIRDSGYTCCIDHFPYIKYWRDGYANETLRQELRVHIK